MHLLGTEALYGAVHRVNRMLECKENSCSSAFITRKCEKIYKYKLLILYFFNFIIYIITIITIVKYATLIRWLYVIIILLLKILQYKKCYVFNFM